MFFTTNRTIQLFQWLTWAFLGLMMSSSTGAAQDQSAGPRYLDVASQGYSRFEISEGDVVAFYTEGVEFTYMNINVSADNLRYNHANQEAIVEGVTRGSLDGATFSCQNLYLNGARGVMEVTGGVHVDYAGTVMDCELLKANFPGGETRLELSDLLVVAGPDVAVVTKEGHHIAMPELTFTGHDLLLTTDSSTTLELALEDASIGQDAVIHLQGLKLEFESLWCRVDDQLNPLEVVLNHITGVSDDITFTAAKLEAVPGQDHDSDITGDWEVQLRNMDGEVTAAGDCLACTALVARCEVQEMQLKRIDLDDSVSVRTNKGAFFADRATAIPYDSGFELILPDDVAVEFNLARLSGQDPIEFNIVGDGMDD